MMSALVAVPQSLLSEVFARNYLSLCALPLSYAHARHNEQLTELRRQQASQAGQLAELRRWASSRQRLGMGGGGGTLGRLYWGTIGGVVRKTAWPFNGRWPKLQLAADADAWREAARGARG